ncbi:MAG: lipopolysaccharide transport periplasmic protein LptA [Alphaproteobacteria bacterium]
MPARTWLGCVRALVLFSAVVLWLALGGIASRAQLDLKERHDTTLPIEIAADSLEVQQDQRIAIFRGNVDAVQGDLHLKADRLTVHYSEGEDGSTTISRIEAQGNVLLLSPADTAQGEKGVYNVKTSTINLLGSVVLTRGQNVIRGERLEVNLVTGLTRVEGDYASGSSGQRVKGLFVPRRSESEN